MILISSIRGVLFTFYPPLAQSQGVSLAFISLIGFVFGASRVGVFALSMRDDVRGFLLHDGNVKKIVMVSLAVCAIGGALPLIGDHDRRGRLPGVRHRGVRWLVHLHREPSQLHLRGGISQEGRRCRNLRVEHRDWRRNRSDHCRSRIWRVSLAPLPCRPRRIPDLAANLLRSVPPRA